MGESHRTLLNINSDVAKVDDCQSLPVVVGFFLFNVFSLYMSVGLLIKKVNRKGFLENDSQRKNWSNQPGLFCHWGHDNKKVKGYISCFNAKVFNARYNYDVLKIKSFTDFIAKYSNFCWKLLVIKSI